MLCGNTCYFFQSQARWKQSPINSADGLCSEVGWKGERWVQEEAPDSPSAQTRGGACTHTPVHAHPSRTCAVARHSPDSAALHQPSVLQSPVPRWQLFNRVRRTWEQGFQIVYDKDTHWTKHPNLLTSAEHMTKTKAVLHQGEHELLYPPHYPLQLAKRKPSVFIFCWPSPMANSFS